MKDNLHNALTLNEIEWIPCISFSAVALTKEIKKLGLNNYENNYEQMAKVSSIGYEAIGFENLFLPFDMSNEVEAMGCSINTNKNSKIKIIDSPFDDIQNIEVPDNFINNGKFPIIEKTIQLLHEKYDDKDVPIIAPMMGPFTLLSQVFSLKLEGIIKHLNNDIVDVEDALWNINTGLLDEIEFYNDLNVDAIAIFEPDATTKLIEPTMYKNVLKPFLEELSNNNEIPSILHICGDTTNNLENMMTSGFEAISIDSGVDINKAKQLQAELNTPTRICGNISTECTLFRKRPKEIFKEAYEILSNGIDIFSPSCMISPNTPKKNIKAMIEARNKFYDL